MRTARLMCLVLAMGAIDARAGDAGLVVDSGTFVSAGELRAVEGPSFDLPANDLDPKGEELNLGWTLVRTALVLGIVISLIYLTLNVGLRRLLGIKAPTTQGLVTVLERVTLDQKRALFVVRAGSDVLLLGASEASVQLISKLEAADVERATVAAEPPMTLSPLLQKLLGSRKKT